MRERTRSRRRRGCRLVLTEWNEFRAVNLAAMKSKMRGDALIDLRNIYPPDLARAAGFIYTSVGRPGDMASEQSDA